MTLAGWSLALLTRGSRDYLRRCDCSQHTKDKKNGQPVRDHLLHNREPRFYVIAQVHNTQF